MNEAASKAKEYLSTFGSLDRAVRRMTLQINDLREDLLCINSYSSEKVQVTRNTNASFTKKLEKLDELETRLAQQYEEKYLERAKMIDKINNIGNDLYSDILYMRYIKGMKNDEIANEMNYCKGYLFDLHNKALEKFTETYLD